MHFPANWPQNTMNVRQVFIILLLKKGDSNFNFEMKLSIFQKENQSWQNPILAHFGCILAHCATRRDQNIVSLSRHARLCLNKYVNTQETLLLNCICSSTLFIRGSLFVLLQIRPEAFQRRTNTKHGCVEALVIAMRQVHWKTEPLTAQFIWLQV